MKRWVFNSSLNCSRLTEVEHRRVGSEFQTTGAATWKLRWPNRVLVRGTSMSQRSAERRCARPEMSATVTQTSLNGPVPRSGGHCQKQLRPPCKGSADAPTSFMHDWFKDVTGWSNPLPRTAYTHRWYSFLFALENHAILNQSINQYAPWYRGACYSADYTETKRNVLSRILLCIRRRMPSCPHNFTSVHRWVMHKWHYKHNTRVNRCNFVIISRPRSSIRSIHTFPQTVSGHMSP